MKWTARRFGVLAALGAAALLATLAQATTVFHVPLEQMTAEAQVIVHARVGAKRVVWDETRTRVLTLTDLEVIEGVKGARKGELLTVYSVGGTLDGVTFKIPGAVPLEPGQEMVFFAMRYRDMLVSYGIGQGKYPVRWAGDTKLVSPEFGDVVFVAKDARGHLEPTDRPDSPVQPLAGFLTRLRALVAGTGGAR